MTRKYQNAWPKSEQMSYEELAGVVNMLVDALKFQSPILNPVLGQIEPPAEYRRSGYMAYADGTNWDPKGDGTNGFFRYDEDTTAWVEGF